MLRQGNIAVGFAGLFQIHLGWKLRWQFAKDGVDGGDGCGVADDEVAGGEFFRNHELF